MKFRSNQSNQFSFGLAAAAVIFMVTSCGDQSTTATTTDTVVQTVVDTVTVDVPVAVPIDSAAVVAYYEAAHKKAKSSHTPKHKVHAVKKDKQVLVDSHEPVEHHEVIQTVAPEPETAPSSSSQAPAETKVVIIHDVQKVYFRPDEKASFPGGEKAFDEYLLNNVEYPEEALQYGVEGVVHAVVFLDEQGKVYKVEFPDGRLGYGLNKEAERLLMNSPRWNPAKHDGQGVKTKFGIPIRFDIK
jgi:outer membrane biosynthesis protein TonB